MLRLPAHEIENLLLDFDVLAAVSGRAAAADIRTMAREHARRLVFWMVCKAALRQMQADLGSGFPGDPPASDALNSLQDVEHHVDRSGYLTSRDAAVKKWSPGAERTGILQRLQATFDADLAQDEWVKSFSGKEILGHLRSHVAGLDATPQRPPQPTSADRDRDLAKRIARTMRDLSRIPPSLTRLHEVLRARAMR